MLVADETAEKVMQKRRGRPRKFPDQPAKVKSEVPKRGRGRPKKDSKGRGRPRKKPLESVGESETSSPKKMTELEADETGWRAVLEDTDEVPKKRGPGRPRKTDTLEDEDMPKKKRGRPKKDPSSTSPTALAPVQDEDTPKRKRGRPKKDLSSSTAQAPAKKRGRGRPPKNPLAAYNTETDEEMVEELLVPMQSSSSHNKFPRLHHDSPMKIVRSEEELELGGKGVMNKFQVLYSDSESEGTEPEGGCIKGSYVED